MKEMINPRLFKPSYRKFAPMYRPKVYFSTLALQGNHYPLKTSKPFKRASDALDYSHKVLNRWCRLYDAAIVAMSTPEPTAEPVQS
jgi:hypothetical protein